MKSASKIRIVQIIIDQHVPGTARFMREGFLEKEHCGRKIAKMLEQFEGLVIEQWNHYMAQSVESMPLDDFGKPASSIMSEDEIQGERLHVTENEDETIEDKAKSPVGAKPDGSDKSAFQTMNEEIAGSSDVDQQVSSKPATSSSAHQASKIQRESGMADTVGENKLPKDVEGSEAKVSADSEEQELQQDMVDVPGKARSPESDMMPTGAGAQEASAKHATAPQTDTPAAGNDDVSGAGDKLKKIGQAATSAQKSTPLPGAQTIPNCEFILPNASIGKPYDHIIQPRFEMPGIAIRDVRIEVDGLTYEPESRRLHGTPVAAGDFKISIRYGIEGQAGHVASEATLIVIPDPRTLWKNLPTDPNDPYWKSDEDCLHIEGSDDFTLIGGSKRGRSHAQKGTFRDDDFFIYSQASTGWQIAVVSDGAGSAKYSRRGSSIICKEGGEYLEKLLAGEDGEKLVTLIEAWHACTASGDECQSEYHHLRNGLFTTIGYAAYHATKMIESECKHRSDLGGTFKDYSSTALLGIVKRFPFGVFCAGFWVGDGAIGAVLDDGTPLLLGVPDGGEYSGQTRFLSPETVTQDELQKRLRFALLQNFKGLYLMSDGVSDPYFQTDAGLEMPDRWAKLVDDVEAAARFADRDPGTADRLVTWLDFWSKGEHDDRTLVIIY